MGWMPLVRGRERRSTSELHHLVDWNMLHFQAVYALHHARRSKNTKSFSFYSMNIGVWSPSNSGFLAALNS